LIELARSCVLRRWRLCSSDRAACTQHSAYNLPVSLQVPSEGIGSDTSPLALSSCAGRRKLPANEALPTAPRRLGIGRAATNDSDLCRFDGCAVLATGAPRGAHDVGTSPTASSSSCLVLLTASSPCLLFLRGHLAHCLLFLRGHLAYCLVFLRAPLLIATKPVLMGVTERRAPQLLHCIK